MKSTTKVCVESLPCSSNSLFALRRTHTPGRSRTTEPRMSNHIGGIPLLLRPDIKPQSYPNEPLDSSETTSLAAIRACVAAPPRRRSHSCFCICSRPCTMEDAATPTMTMNKIIPTAINSQPGISILHFPYTTRSPGFPICQISSRDRTKTYRSILVKPAFPTVFRAHPAPDAPRTRLRVRTGSWRRIRRQGSNRPVTA